MHLDLPPWLCDLRLVAPAREGPIQQAVKDSARAKDPVVKTSPSSAAAADSIPDWGAKISRVSQPKKNRSDIVTSSIKTLKMVHIKKKNLKKKCYLFYFWFCWVFVAEQGLPPVVASGHYSSLRCLGFLRWWLLLLWSPGSGWAVSIVAAHEFCCPTRHVESSRTGDQTCVPCFSRWILIHCTTREKILKKKE